MGRLVLIADGDAERAERVGEACALRGFVTELARNGAEALEVALNRVPDVLVADAALEVIEACKVADILRANPRTQNVQFLLVGESPNESVDNDSTAPLALADPPEDVAQRIEALLVGEAGLEPGEEGEEEVRGRVAQIPLPDLLQLFHLNRRSGTIELKHRTPGGREERGRITLRDGDVIQAVTGPVQGEKALYRLLGWSDGSFSFRPGRAPIAPRIQTATRALLLEGMRQLDEWRRIGSSLPRRDARVALRVASADLPSVVHPLTQEVLLLLEIYSRVGDLVDHCTFPDYQVLRTLQTLEARGLVEIRSGPAPEPADAGLFTEAQGRRLREWLTPALAGEQHVRDPKLLLVSPDRHTTRDFLRLLTGLPGVQLEARFESGKVPEDELGPVGRLAVDDQLGIELFHVPSQPGFASLWPLAGYGALGTLALASGSVAQAQAALRPALESLGRLPRPRIFHVLLLREGDGDLPEEIRENLSLLDEGSVFLLPLDSGRDPVAVLRNAFSRIVP